MICLLLDTCEELAQKPFLGKNYENISRDMFGYLAEKHIIFYRIIANSEIEIVRILHGQMDIENRIIE